MMYLPRYLAVAVCLGLVASRLAAAPLDAPIPIDMTLPSSPTPATGDKPPARLEDALGLSSSGSRTREHPALAAAEAALDAGDVRKSLSLLSDAARENPALPPDLLMLAQLYLARQRWQEASLALENAVANYQQHPEVYHQCGFLALAQRRNADAWLHFEKALSLPTPKAWSAEQVANFHSLCWSGLAEICERRRDWVNAGQVYERWSQVVPPNERVLQFWGKALVLSGNEQDGLAKLTAAYKQNPSLNPGELAVAAIYVQQGNWESAKTWYLTAIEKFPQSGRAHFEYAGALLLFGHDKLATEQLQRAIARPSGLEDLSVEVLLLQGLLARGAKQYAAAETQFTKVLEKSPGEVRALAQLPLVLVAQNDAAKQRRALQIATLNATRHPSPDSFAALGWVQFNLGKHADAEKNLRKASSQGDYGEALYFLAQLQLETGNIENINDVLRRLRLALDKPGLFVTRGEAREWLKSVAATTEPEKAP